MTAGYDPASFVGSVCFSISSHAQWAPGVESDEAWTAWANDEMKIEMDGEPLVKAMPSMLRRRASSAGRMALEVAYQCLPHHLETPVVFASRNGECARSVELFGDLSKGLPLSPTSFSLSVHNASPGLFSIARKDHSNSIAVAAGASSAEHAIIEACGLLADGAPQVLVVMFDRPLPAVFASFSDNDEPAFAWAWLLEAEARPAFSLSWSAATITPTNSDSAMLDVLRFQLRKDSELTRVIDQRCWQWRYHA